MISTATLTSGHLEPIPWLPPGDVIFGIYPGMSNIRHESEEPKGTNFTVLLRGQSGTGREVFAKLIHSQPWRKSESLVNVSCSFFNGANGATSRRTELAQLGTLFLDEISELDPYLQATRAGAA